MTTKILVVQDNDVPLEIIDRFVRLKEILEEYNICNKYTFFSFEKCTVEKKLDTNLYSYDPIHINDTRKELREVLAAPGKISKKTFEIFMQLALNLQHTEMVIFIPNGNKSNLISVGKSLARRWFIPQIDLSTVEAEKAISKYELSLNKQDEFYKKMPAKKTEERKTVFKPVPPASLDSLRNYYNFFDTISANTVTTYTGTGIFTNYNFDTSTEIFPPGERRYNRLVQLSETDDIEEDDDVEEEDDIE